MEQSNKNLEKTILKYSINERGIGRLEWNDPESDLNMLSSKALKELKELLPELEKNSVKVLVLVLKNLAGADLRELKDISQEVFARQLDEAHEIFNRFESLKATKIAVLKGVCLGGGLELALTCDYRLAANSPKTRFGLPEVQLGLIPGLGGCFRLPRRVGLKAGLEMILSGKTFPAKFALDVGLVDEKMPDPLLEEQAMVLACQVIKGEKEAHPSQKFKPNSWKKFLLEGFLFRSFIFFLAKKKLLLKTKGFYPAPLKAWQVVRKTFRSSLSKSLLMEKEAFLEMVFTSESQNLIRLFFLKIQVEKREAVVYRSGPWKVGVLGAGIMGGGIARLLADKGQSVRLRDLKAADLSSVFKKADEFWTGQVSQGKVKPWEWQKKRDHLSLTQDLSGFSKMDIVIEALPEDKTLKRQVFREMGGHLTPDQVVASNTSSLSIGDLASAYPWPERVVGMHFFNPVHKMPLVEIVRTERSDSSAVSRAFCLAKKLGKVPVIVKDSPGFIVNRLLMPYLSEALWFFMEGYNIKEVDRCYTQEFGFSIGPFRLMDEVGLDLCLKVIESFEAAGLSVFLPAGVKEILQNLGSGRKQGSGFYRYKKRSIKVSKKTFQLQKSSLEINSTECIHRGLYRLINEALRIREEGVAREEDIDLAGVLGMGFPPFLGGPVKYARDRGLSVIENGLKDFFQRLGPRFAPESSLFR